MSEQILSFYLGDELCGLPASDVQSVIRSRNYPLTRVPRAAPEILGILSLRGRIAPAISLRRCVRLPDGPKLRDGMALVVEDKGELYCLAVDRVGGVLSFDGPAAPPPPAMGIRWRAFVSGVRQAENALLAQFDVQAVIAALAGRDAGGDA